MASSSGWNHDVFLSFRGPDTRNTFTGHLYHALKAKGINSFIDNELERGQHICDSLIKVIEGSRISIVIFSADYAGSSSCLEELVKILECRERRGQLVLPVFYNVNPSDVEKYSGPYADSLAKLGAQSEVNLQKMEEWRLALSQTSTLSGWHLDKGNEAKLIQTIVEEVSLKLNRVPLCSADHPVGLESRIQDMTDLLSFETKEVQFVGIHGLGGIGKTTIAKAVFNKHADQFEGSCFLASVKDTRNEKGFSELQEILLMKTLGLEKIMLGNTHEGIEVIRRRLNDKRVLIVIDDVDKLNQLKTFVGAPNWFGPGSRIIITTRDEQLLKAHEVKRIHYVKELCHEYALELFSWNAFKKPQPNEDFLELSRSIIKYAQGLPLALVVLGSFLYGRGKLEWESELQNLNRNPNKEINDILKISFDNLESYQKNIFLHIACFFKGKNKKYVMKILDACDLNPTIGVKVLEEKSLIRIKDDNIEMHELVEAMGRQVVNDESPNISERSRLWDQDELFEVLTEDMGPFKTEALVCRFKFLEEVSVEVFAKMKRLEILILQGASISRSLKSLHNDLSISRSLESLSNDLRWLEWPGCPLESLPSKFRARKLVALKLPCSRIRELGACFKSFVNLKDLNLSYCSVLTKTPDFSTITNLKSLNLSECENLVEVHESVGYLNKLKYLDLTMCCRLEKLPSKFRLRSLFLLSLYGCIKLTMFPEMVEMTCLVRIDLSMTVIRFLPSSISSIRGLKELNLSYCEEFEDFPEIVVEMTCLETINLSRTAIRLLPSSICNIRGLKSLFLNFCKQLETLPSSILYLKDLKNLCLGRCIKLKEIPELPLNVEKVEAESCYSLERYSQLPRIFAFNWKAKSFFNFSDCHKLAKSLDTISSDWLQNHEFGAKSSIELTFPGSKIPKWFNYISENKTSFSFEITSQACGKLEALVVSAIINAPLNFPKAVEVYAIGQTVRFPAEMHFARKNGCDHVWLYYLRGCSFKKHVTTAKTDNIQFEVSIKHMFSKDRPFKSFGVHFVYGQGVNPDNIIGWSSTMHRHDENVDRTIGKVIEDSLIVVNNSVVHQNDLMVDENQMHQGLSQELQRSRHDKSNEDANPTAKRRMIDKDSDSVAVSCVGSVK